MSKQELKTLILERVEREDEEGLALIAQLLEDLLPTTNPALTEADWASIRKGDAQAAAVEVFSLDQVRTRLTAVIEARAKGVG